MLNYTFVQYCDLKDTILQPIQSTRLSFATNTVSIYSEGCVHFSPRGTGGVWGVG